MNLRNDVQSIQQVFESPAAREVRASQGQGKDAAASGFRADEATVSSAGSLAARALALPDVRMDKVAQVQQALADNSYHVSASQLAESLIQHMSKV